MRFPRTLLEFQAQFRDEASDWVYLREARWPQGFLCPRCASRGSHFLAMRRLEQCRSCRSQGSVTAGTGFHGTRVPLRVWFHRVGQLPNTAGAARLAGIPRATTAVLISFVQDSIQPQEPTVFTDAWGSYAALRRLGIDARPRKGGRGHQSVPLLPWTHTVFGNLKAWLRGTFHGVSPKHLQRHLDEFVFRFERRWRETELLPRVLHRALVDAFAA